jgi:hypothetical protein
MKLIKDLFIFIILYFGVYFLIDYLFCDHPSRVVIAESVSLLSMIIVSYVLNVGLMNIIPITLIVTFVRMVFLYTNPKILGILKLKEYGFFDQIIGNLIFSIMFVSSAVFIAYFLNRFLVYLSNDPKTEWIPKVIKKNNKRLGFYSFLMVSIFVFIEKTIGSDIFISKIFPKTVYEVVIKYGQQVDLRMAEYLNGLKIRKYTIIVIKNEEKLELWGETENRENIFIKDYSLTTFSGNLGPKLRKGDNQIPEGIYSIEYLNPNSSYHLSMKINYPNEFDKKMAEKDGRNINELGNDIFIHGKDVSIGCIAIGDKAIEDLFVLTAKIGKDNVKVIISPYDCREHSDFIYEKHSHEWIGNLYEKICAEMMPFKKSENAVR